MGRMTNNEMFGMSLEDLNRLGITTTSRESQQKRAEAALRKQARFRKEIEAEMGDVEWKTPNKYSDKPKVSGLKKKPGMKKPAGVKSTESAAVAREAKREAAEEVREVKETVKATTKETVTFNKISREEELKRQRAEINRELKAIREEKKNKARAAVKAREEAEKEAAKKTKSELKAEERERIRQEIINISADMAEDTIKLLETLDDDTRAHYENNKTLNVPVSIKDSDSLQDLKNKLEDLQLMGNAAERLELAAEKDRQFLEKMLLSEDIKLPLQGKLANELRAALDEAGPEKLAAIMQKFGAQNLTDFYLIVKKANRKGNLREKIKARFRLKQILKELRS